MTGCSGKGKWGKALYSKQLLILSCGPIKGIFKKDLKGNMEHSFSLDGETQQYWQNSVASQRGKIESTGKPWGMRGFRLHPQTQTGWAFLPVTSASSEPVTLTSSQTWRYGNTNIMHSILPRGSYLYLFGVHLVIFFVQDTIFEPSLQSGAFIPYLQVGITRCGPLQS